MEVDPREFGRLEAEVEALRSELAEHKKESRESLSEAMRKIDELLALANKGRGAWWAALTLGSTISAFIGYVTSHFLSR